MSKKVHTNIWSAYGFAQKAGYEGTEEEFEQGLKKSAEAAENAEESASTASEAATEANAARDEAAQSAESASTSEGNALEYANSAAQVLRDAQAVAQTVNAKANEAAGSASRAENYAQTATTKASEATTAAGTATTAASSASVSAQAADASATAAAASETNAAASASSASTSAGSASESADDAAASAAAAQEVKDSIPADYTALSDEVTDLKSGLINLSDGNQDCMLHAKFYDGYYNGTPAYTGTGTEGKGAGWGVCVVQVPVGKQITLSGFDKRGGVNSCWLNSSDPADVKQTAWGSLYNDGTKTCVTGWLGIADYNYVALADDLMVNYAITNYIKAEIASNKEEYDLFVKAKYRDDTILTDNCFSDRLSDWKQGLHPNGSESYGSYIDIKNDVQDAPIYIVSAADTGYTSYKIMIYVFDDEDTFLRGFDMSVGTARNYNILDFEPTASYFYIAINSGSSSISVNPKDCVNHFKAYVGYSNIQYLSEYYPMYINEYANKLFDSSGLYVTDSVAGAFTDSRNFYSNNPDDWNYPAYNASQKSSIPVEVTERGLTIMHDRTTVPDVLASGTLNVREYDSSNNLLHTGYHSLAAVDREIRHITLDSDCAYLRIDFNTGDVNKRVNASDIRKLKVYVGVPLFTAYSVFPKVDFPEKSIPKQARTLMDGGYLPDYWLEYLDVKKDTLDNLTDTIGNHGFSFAFITDEHWAANYQKSPYIMRWLKEHTAINRFVSGGDILNEHESIADAMRYMRDWRDITDELRMRNLRGNHDDNSMQVDPEKYLGDGRFYSNLIAQIESDVSVENGNLYYYEKIEAQKVCIFYLDTGDIVTPTLIDFDAQISWMSNIVSSLTSDWSILVIQHIVYDGGTQDNPTIYTMGQKTITFLNGVTNCNVIGLIAGHTHYDYSDTSNGYPIIITNCDSAQRAQTLPATAGTVSEQLFDVFHIDTENRKIYATRIGAGSDREWSY